MLKKFTIIVILLSSFLPITPTFAQKTNVHEPIRGIYVRASNTQGTMFHKLITLMDKSDLNAMVIDIKDDFGNLTYRPAFHSPYVLASKSYIKNPKELMKTLKDHRIYPIARIVVFKDNFLAQTKPVWSFQTKEDNIWKNKGGDSFTNPFVKQVWDYNVGIAIEAALLGFKEIQFDYVRFPEKFESIQTSLSFEGKGKDRVEAVSGFVEYARKKLKPFHVKMSVDTFGNTTVIHEATGIGQNFTRIAQYVDVISAMIYPSHWTSNFGIEKPDLEPYCLVSEYAKVEKARLKELTHPPVSRPWIQDFTASWLGQGNYKVYGKKEIEDQIRALHSQGIDEYLLWNAANHYTNDVDYTPY